MEKEVTKPIIILSGPVGAGKTTVARELISLIPGPSVYIEGDKFWFFIVKSKADRQKNFRTIMASMTAAALPYAIAGYSVLLDFSIPPRFLETVQRMTTKREIPIDYILLNPGKEICARRAASRSEGAIADYTSYEEFYDTFTGADQFTLCDTTSGPGPIASKVFKGLQEQQYRMR